MRFATLLLLLGVTAVLAELKPGPPLPHKLVKDWAKLPEGWNFGETSGVDVDKNDNVWVFNRGPHPVIQFDKTGKMVQAWKEVPVKSSHGLRVDPDGNIWTIDVAGHAVLRFSPAGRLQLVIAQPGNREGGMDVKDAFNRPTGVAFTKTGDFYVADGYVNSRVIRFNKEGVFSNQWGKKGTGDGEFDLVHDVAVDAQGRVYVADRTNSRVQVFDENGKFLNKWTDVGAPWGLYYAAKENMIYMCDGLNNRVVKLNLDGQIQGVLGSYGKAQGKFDFAHNLAVDSEGSIYVAEIKNWRVQKFAK